MAVVRDARTRLARKPGALARELLRNFPKRRNRGRRRRRRGGANGRGASNQSRQQKVESVSENGAQAKSNGNSKAPQEKSAAKQHVEMLRAKKAAAQKKPAAKKPAARKSRAKPKPEPDAV